MKAGRRIRRRDGARATLIYGVHMLEETMYGWHDWVRKVLKMQAEMNEFYMVNAVVIVLGASCAMVGWKNPAFALSFPAFMVVNAFVSYRSGIGDAHFLPRRHHSSSFVSACHGMDLLQRVP